MDVISTSTTAASRLTNEDLDAHIEYINLVDVLEAETLSSWCPCPISVLRGIILINRARMLDSQQQLIPSTLGENLAKIKDTLLRFNPVAWADDLLTRSDAIPDSTTSLLETRAEWTSLAQAYQAAALLYLFRTLAAAGEQSGLGEESEDLFSQTKALLGEALHPLFSSFSMNPNGTEGPRLWRFCLWPLFIDAFDSAVWGSSTATQVPVMSMEQKIQRFRSVGLRLGTSTMNDAAELLSGLLKSHTTGRSRSWDDGFPDYSVFVV